MQQTDADDEDGSDRGASITASAVPDESSRRFLGLSITSCLHIALIIAQVAFAGFEIISRVTLDDGAGKFAFSFYRNCVSSLILGGVGSVIETRHWKNLKSFGVIATLFLLGLVGVTINQVFYLYGLDYTSPVFASAMRNLTPVITFLLAWIYRLENINIRQADGIIKTSGCFCGIMGSIFLSIYRGPVLIKSHSSLFHLRSQKEDKYKFVNIRFTRWIHGLIPAKSLGSVYLVISCVSFSVYLIIQAKLFKKFPAPVTSAALMCFFSLLQIPVLAALFEPGKVKWQISKTEMISIIYSGIFASGLVSSIQAWVIQNKGPVLVAAYQPLETAITGIMAFFLLKETLRMGSIVGGIIVIFGLYLLILGQSIEQRKIKELSQNPGNVEVI